MRKLFSFCAAMFAALALNAAVINITAETANSLKTAVTSANAGDTIVLAAGTYSEPEQVKFDKSLTVMAAEGAKPIIALHYYCSITDGANVKVIGLKFDGSIYPATDHCFRPYSNHQNKLYLDNCEFTGFPNLIIYSNNGARKLEELAITNCYFYNNVKSAVHFAKSTESDSIPVCKKVEIYNSTFAKFTGLDKYVIDVRNYNETAGLSDVQILVDHCTFYDFAPASASNDYGAVVSTKSENVVISNCIMAQPASSAQYATKLYGGTVQNVLTYNLTKGKNASGHNQSSGKPALTDTIVANPLFVDAAQGDYTLAANSPAIGAGTESSNLGDPRWWPVIGAPEYYLVGTMNNWTPAEAYKFEANPGAEGEYMLTAALAAGDSLKVLEVLGITQTWYPAGTDNDYVVDAAHAGAAKKIYFRPNADGGEGWYHGVIFVEENQEPDYQVAVLQYTGETTTNMVGEGANNAATLGLDADLFTVLADKGSNQNLPGLNKAHDIRLYADKNTGNGNIITVSIANGTIHSIALDIKQTATFVVKAGETAVTEAEGVYAINGTSFSIQNTTSGATTQLQLNKITINYTADEPIIGAPEYYLVGSLNNWTPDSTYKFAKNPANENEYMLATTLAVGDSIKVLEIVGNTRTYYPAGTDNDYVVDAAHAGEKTIYFQTTYKADWAAFGGYIWIDANEPVSGCDWANIAWVEGEPANQYKVCKEGAYPGVVNIQQPGWAAEKGIYMTFENAVFGNFSLDTTKYAIDGAGVVFYLSAFTAKETEVTVQNNNAVVTFTVYNENGTEPQPEVNYSLKNNWDAAADWTWKEMTKDGDNYKLENVVFGGTGVNYKADLLGAPEIWVPDSMILGDKIAAKDTVTFVLNPADSTITATLIGKYVEPAPVPEWAVIKFNQVVPKDSLAADASFVLLGSDFKAQITDTENKMEIDANVARFGEAAGYDTFTHRLKTGGKSSATKSYITVSIPETGKLAIAVRTGSNSATDRNLVVKQGNDTLYNQIILESQAIKVMEDTTEVSVYPYIMLPVDSGTVVLSYPVGALNFYAFAFKKEQPIIAPEYYLVGNMNDWKAAEGYKFAANPAAEGEYMLTTTLALGNEFKVLGTGSIENTWYPDNAGNYVVTADYVGEKTIYFRPAGNPDWEGFHAGGYFYMEANPAPAGKITCDSVYNLAKGDTVALAPVTVTYANGKNLYVKDATGAMLVYLGANGTWKAGDVLSNVEGVLDIYNGLYEVKTDTNQMKAITAVEGPVPAPEELDTIRLADINKYIKIKDIQVAADTAIHSTGKATNINIIFDEDTIVLRNNFLLEYAFEAGKKYDITGVISYYVAKGASVGTLQVFPTAIEEQQIIGAPEYYLAGSMNGWAANADYKFAENPAKAGEYMLTTALALNDEFKVIGVVGATTNWYPTGMGNNYKVDADHAGAAKTIYFNPNGGQEGWYEGYFYVEPNVVPMENPIFKTEFFTNNTWDKDTLSSATWDADNQKVIVDIVLSKCDQWQGQVWLKLPMEVRAGYEYDLAFTIKANKTFSGTTVKYQENAEMHYNDKGLALTADEAYVYEVKNMRGLANGNGVLCFSFGYAPAETLIEIYNMSIIEHEPTAPIANFYVTGNDAFTVDAGKTTAESWHPDAFPSYGDTLTVALKAGAAYQLKVCVDGSWNTAKNFNDLTEVTPGIIDADGNNHNIGFSLVEDGEVMVIYTGEVFKVVGNFVTQGLNDIDASVKAVKVLRNGQIFILRGDKVYTVTGQPVK